MAGLNVASATNDDLRSILMVYGLDEKEIKGLERNHLVSRIEKILASEGEGQLQNAPAAAPAAPAAAAPAAAPAAAAPAAAKEVKPKIERTGVVQKVQIMRRPLAAVAPAAPAAPAAPSAANRAKPPQHPLPSAAVKNCGGVLPATFLEISGNGDCLYAAILQGLERHPCGNLITRTHFYPSVAALRTYVVTDPIFTECFGNMYDILNSTSIEDLHVLADTESGMNDMYPWWTINWIIEEKENIKVPSNESFIDEAIRRVSTTSEYATACEVSIIRSELEKKGIAVNIVTSRVQDNGTRIDPLSATVDFGTTENPIITLLYNGRNHYDALIHVAGLRGGRGGRGGRSKRSKTSKSKKSKTKKSKTKKSKTRKSKNRK